MATFKYKAISTDGANVSGVVEAYDEIEAVGIIKQSCKIVTSVAEVEPTVEKKDIFGGSKVDIKNLALFCSQFGIILRAGLPMVRSIELIAGQTEDKVIKSMLEKVADDVASGHSLADSFESKGKGLPTTFIETIRAGEESGTLDQSCERLERALNSQYKTKKKIRGAMAQPVFMLVLIVIVMAIMMVAVFPVFDDMFASLGAELPGLTKGLIAISNFLRNNIIILVIVAVALVFGIRIYKNTEHGRMFFAKLTLKIPGVKTISNTGAANTFANTCGTLMSSGLSVIRAVETTSRVIGNYFIATQLNSIIPWLEEGRSLGDSMREISCFPNILTEMCAIGEDSGSLDDTLETMSEYYEAELENAISKALGILNPAITIFMGVGVGAIVIGLYLPLFSMYGNLM